MDRIPDPQPISITLIPFVFFKWSKKFFRQRQAQLGGRMSARAKCHPQVDPDWDASIILEERSRQAGSAVFCQPGWDGNVPSRLPSN